MQQLRKLFLVVALLVALTGSALAQNDFPSPGFNPGSGPTNQPFVPGVVPGQGGNYGYGVAWGPQVLLGIPKGSTVYFDIVMDWWGFARMNLAPQSDQGDDFKYLDDGGSEWSKWVWPDIGNFCFRCRWSFRTTDEAPVLSLNFFGSDQFGAHIEVTGFDPPPFPPFKWTGPYLNEASKNQAYQLSIVGMALSHAALGGAAVTCSTGNYMMCGIFAVAGIGSGMGTLWLQTIANDPWDPNYQYPFWNQYNQDEVNAESSWCQVTADYDTSDGYIPQLCNSITYFQTGFNSYLEASAITLDRYSSCVAVGDPCVDYQRDLGITYLHQAGDYAYYLATFYTLLSSYTWDNGLNVSGEDPAGWLSYSSWVLYQTYLAFASVQ